MEKSQNTREGAASIYIVIFTTMLLSIIALSFVRIMVSEANQTTNYSLSQSAYNSAMAGVEDAKIALLKYQNCISTNNKIDQIYGRGECEHLRSTFQATDANDDCDIVKTALRRPLGDQETLISSSQTNNRFVEQTSKAIDQAYTCVKVAVDTDDYISKLNNNNMSKYVPLRALNNEKGLNQNSIDRMVISWFSDDDASNATNGSITNYASFVGSGKEYSNIRGSSVTANYTKTRDNTFSLAENTIKGFGATGTLPPALKIELFQTSTAFALAQFYEAGNNGQTNRGSIILRPYEASGDISIIGSDYNTSGFVASAMKGNNVPTDVKCQALRGTSFTSGYACTAEIVIPPVISGRYNAEGVRVDSASQRNMATSLLRISNPYGAPETTFEVKLYSCGDRTRYASKGQCTPMKFSGVQSLVDSTGRANDLLRRVETRMEMIDTYFPQPDAELTVMGSGDSKIEKNYYVTNNCISQTSTMGATSVSTSRSSCDNFGTPD